MLVDVVGRFTICPFKSINLLNEGQARAFDEFEVASDDGNSSPLNSPHQSLPRNPCHLGVGALKDCQMRDISPRPIAELRLNGELLVRIGKMQDPGLRGINFDPGAGALLSLAEGRSLRDP